MKTKRTRAKVGRPLLPAAKHGKKVMIYLGPKSLARLDCLIPIYGGRSKAVRAALESLTPQAKTAKETAT